RIRRQIEQPRAYDAAMLPDARDLAHVEAELRLLKNLEPFAIRLEHTVLDAIMHHLDEVTGAVHSHIAVTILWGQRLEDRLARLEVLVFAAAQQAVAFFQAPEAPAGAAVHVVQPFGADLLGAADRVMEVGVAAVDDDIARLEQGHDVMQRVVGDLAGWDHQPD